MTIIQEAEKNIIYGLLIKITHYSLLDIMRPVIWNNLPLEIKSLNSMNIIKRKLKSYLITSVVKF